MCRSVDPPVPAVNPTSTFGGTVTAASSRCVPSTFTTTWPGLTDTSTWWVALRRPATVALAGYWRRPLAYDVDTPTKLFDGSPVFCHVSRATATPAIPPKPRPPPGAPTVVGAVLELASAKVMPS